MKRVLVVSFDFPPQGGTGTIRVAKFVKYLPDYGWEPVVVCSDADWNPDETLAQDVPPEVTVCRVPWPSLVRPFVPRPSPSEVPVAGRSGSIPGLASRVRRRAYRVVRPWLIPDPNLLWTGAAKQACSAVLRDRPCAAVFTTSPPNSIHLVGKWVRQRFALPWVADFRDVWTAENPTLRKAGHVHFALQRMLERQMLNSCDRAIMNREPLAQRTLDVFGERLAHKFTTITNGFDPADFTGPAPVPDPDRFTITYVGTILGEQVNYFGPQVDNAFPDGLRLALAQDDEFRRRTVVRFVGVVAPSYQARLAGMEANVEIGKFLPHGDAIAQMRRSDVLLLLLPNTRLASMTHTNKFFEYLAARRPILAVVPPGLISDIVEQGIGRVAPPEEPAAIARSLVEMFNVLRARPDSYQGRPEIYAAFDRRQLAGQLASVLHDLTQMR
jgi:glycosyltransferase involved in cell wall biosynthesis